MGQCCLQAEPCSPASEGEVMSALQVCTAVLVGRAVSIPAPMAESCCLGLRLSSQEGLSIQPRGGELLPCLALETTLSAQPSPGKVRTSRLGLPDTVASVTWVSQPSPALLGGGEPGLPSGSPQGALLMGADG